MTQATLPSTSSPISADPPIQAFIRTTLQAGIMLWARLGGHKIMWLTNVPYFLIIFLVSLVFACIYLPFYCSYCTSPHLSVLVSPFRPFLSVLFLQLLLCFFLLLSFVLPSILLSFYSSPLPALPYHAAALSHYFHFLITLLRFSVCFPCVCCYEHPLYRANRPEELEPHGNAGTRRGERGGGGGSLVTSLR